VLASAAGVLLLRRVRNRERPPAAAAPVPVVQDNPAQPDWRDGFVGMLAHELRNPLGAISAAADVLESTHPTSGSAADARSVIARQARQLSHTVHGLLEASRALAGKISVVRRPVELAALVRHVEETLAFTGELRQHALVLALEPCWVDGDSVRLEEVVSALITQAARQAPAESEIRVRLRCEGPVVLQLVCVTQRTQPPTHSVEWTLARALIQLHRGTLEANASEGEMRFEIRLPAATHPQMSEPSKSVTPLNPLDKE